MDILKFDDIFKQSFFNFWLLGIPPKNQINGKLSLRFIIFFSATLLVVIEELLFFFSKISLSENFLELTALAPCIGVATLSMLKISSIASSRSKIYLLHESLKELYYEISSNERKRDLVMNKVRMVYKFTKYNLGLNVVLVTLYTFLSLALLLYDYIVKGEIVYYLPFAVVVPFSTDTFWNWLLVYIHSGICTFICLAYFITVDNLYYNLSVQVCCNFTVLGDEIEHLQPHDDVGTFSAIVEKHQYILKLSEDLEDIFTVPNFYNVLIGSILICALGFNLMLGDLKQIPRVALSLLLHIMLIFLMSVFGGNLITESTKIAKKAYLCEWYNMDKKAKKMLLLLMTRANKPQILTAYKFSTISYESFTKIISTSWSYFTLLRTVYDSSEISQIK